MVAEVLRGTLSGSGSGYGYGYGDGSGSGSGSGSGDGDGDGSGSGYGDGDGSGSGYGYGYGYGDGSGSGSGDGDGSGSGDGDGDGSGSGYGSYWLSAMPSLMKNWTSEQRDKFQLLNEKGVKLAFWRSDAEGHSANGGRRIIVAAAGVTHTEKGPLNLCASGTLHATLTPPKWSGERIWIVALHGEVVGDDEKFGCLKREIIGECSFA